MSGEAAVPSVLLEWIDRWSGRPLDTPLPSLVEAGRDALASALSRPTGDRQTAHALLAADASLTAAVERSAEAVDPGRELRGVVDRIVALSSETGDDV